MEAFYWQLGWLPTEKLSIFVQEELYDVSQTADIFVDGVSRFRDRKDTAFGVSYSFLPNLVLKAEHHEVENQASVRNEIVFGPGGIKIRQVIESFDADYSILSLATSF